MITKNELLKEFIRPGSPIAYSSPYRVYKYYKGEIPLLTVKKWLHGQDTYTLHRQAKKPSPRNPTFAYYKRYQFQIDLIELGWLSSENKNYKYLLTAIDIFTRFAFVEPIKSKKAAVFLKGFKSIMKRAKQFPRKILADRGTEIRNRTFQNYCKNNNIHLLHSDNFLHAPFIERFNRSLKNLMYKYMDENDTNKFIDVLPLLVKTYNLREHRMIGMSPTDAEKDENKYKIRWKQEEYYAKIKKRKPKFKKGQTVRINILQGQFDKGYNQQFLAEIYRIVSVNTRLPIPTYTLETLDGDETVEGNFYANELIDVEPPELFKIEKILKKKKEGGRTMVLVKWQDYRNPSWIPESDIEDINTNTAETDTEDIDTEERNIDTENIDTEERNTD